MTLKIAYLGPTGTNTETAGLAYLNWLKETQGQIGVLSPCSSIAQTLKAVAESDADLAVVPVENSTQGSVTITLDSIWELDHLKITQALILPINHALITHQSSLDQIDRVFSHPQALAQCQHWLEEYLPNAQLVATNSTTEALHKLDQEDKVAAIASPRAAKLYNLPILKANINDYPENKTRFWVLGRESNSEAGSHISLAFSLPANVPGALMNPLEIFASRGINLSRIESRPTKRSLGEYLFFIDLEVHDNQELVNSALVELETHTEVLKIFGNYNVLDIE
jgi:prephenate dehydratase